MSDHYYKATLTNEQQKKIDDIVYQIVQLRSITLLQFVESLR